MTEPTPKSFVAGDTVTWSFSDAEYSSQDGYKCDYQFVAPGLQHLVSGIAQSDGSWLFTITAAESITWRPDAYGWQRYISQAGERYTRGAGWTHVHVNYAVQSAGTDPRPYWRRVVDAIEATMEGRATADMNQYTFAGRSLTKMTLAELQSFHGYATSKLNAYLQATGQGGKSRIIRTVI